MTSTFLPTAPGTDAAASYALADLLEKMHEFADGADSTELFKRLVADGADGTCAHHVVIDWIELRFLHLQNMVSIVQDPMYVCRYELRIYGCDSSGQPFIVTASLPRVFRDVYEERF